MTPTPIRGRLGSKLAPGAKADRSPISLDACSVTATYTEGGALTIAVSGRAEYLPGAYVGATIEGDEIPQALREKVQKALTAVLDEAHDDLKAEALRETYDAVGNSVPGEEV